MNENNGVLDVISGKQSLKIDINIDYLSAAILGIVIFTVGLLLIIIGKRI